MQPAPQFRSGRHAAKGQLRASTIILLSLLGLLFLAAAMEGLLAVLTAPGRS